MNYFFNFSKKSCKSFYNLGKLNKGLSSTFKSNFSNINKQSFQNLKKNEK